jgi:hypothetical protein
LTIALFFRNFDVNDFDFLKGEAHLKADLIPGDEMLK